MNINDFSASRFVGTALSLIIQFIKEKTYANGFEARLLTIILSVVVGAAYWFLNDTAIWESVLGVLAAASTVYALFIKE